MSYTYQKGLIDNQDIIYLHKQYVECRNMCDQLKNELGELKDKIENATCHRGHKHLPLTLWNCPACVENEKKELNERIAQLEINNLSTLKILKPLKAQVAILKENYYQALRTMGHNPESAKELIQQALQGGE